MEDEESQHTTEALEPSKRKRNSMSVFSCSPVHWLRKLCDELHWSFVLGVVVVYGINQGLAVGLSAVSIKYYMKDEQKLQPSEAQVYFGIIQLPWIVKPLWGLLTDTVPVRGYRRRPYFVVAGLLGSISMLTLSLNKNLDLAFALLALMGASAGIAIADVTIDACVTQNSISHPSLAGDMQSLCGLSSSMGSLIGFLISGFIVHLIGPKGVFGVLSIPPILVIVTGFVLRETHVQSSTYKRVKEKFMDATKGMYTALKCKDVWRPCLYMYLSLALSLNIHEGMFYWITDAKGGPLFSQEIIGSIFSVGAAGSLFGILIYQNFLRNHPFRDILLWTQLLHGTSGLLDLMLVLRLNLRVGVPDYFFIVIDEAVSRMIVRLKWMPLLVLSSKLCPAGIEGTFFALLMSIDHVGMLSSSWAGGIVLHILDITRTKFNNLWLAILMRSIMRILPVGLLFLIPRSDPNAAILPAEMLKSKKGDDILDPDNVEMASLIHSS